MGGGPQAVAFGGVGMGGEGGEGEQAVTGRSCYRRASVNFKLLLRKLPRFPLSRYALTTEKASSLPPSGKFKLLLRKLLNDW